MPAASLASWRPRAARGARLEVAGLVSGELEGRAPVEEPALVEGRHFALPQPQRDAVRREHGVVGEQRGEGVVGRVVGLHLSRRQAERALEVGVNVKVI